MNARSTAVLALAMTLGSCSPNPCGHVQLYANAMGTGAGSISTSIDLGTCTKDYTSPPAAGARWIAQGVSSSPFNPKPPVSGNTSGTSAHTACCAG